MSKTKNLAVLAILTALTVIFFYIPGVLLVPLILTVLIYGFKKGLFVTAVFITVSVVSSYINATPIALVFRLYPHVAVLPRLVIPFTTYGAALLMRKLIGEKKRAGRIATAAVTALTAVLTNSVLVIGTLLLFYGSTPMGDTTVTLFAPVLLGATVTEIIASVLAVPIVYLVAKPVLAPDKRLIQGNESPEIFDNAE